MTETHRGKPPVTGRRGFLTRLFAGIISAVLTLVPAGAGLIVLFDPLRRKGTGGGAVRVASLDALPVDAVPRQFPVFADHVDAWNKFSNVRIGAVYLRRTEQGK